MFCFYALLLYTMGICQYRDGVQKRIRLYGSHIPLAQAFHEHVPKGAGQKEVSCSCSSIHVHIPCRGFCHAMKSFSNYFDDPEYSPVMTER